MRQPINSRLKAVAYLFSVPLLAAGLLVTGFGGGATLVGAATAAGGATGAAGALALIGATTVGLCVRTIFKASRGARLNPFKTLTAVAFSVGATFGADLAHDYAESLKSPPAMTPKFDENPAPLPLTPHAADFFNNVNKMQIPPPEDKAPHSTVAVATAARAYTPT